MTLSAVTLTLSLICFGVIKVSSASDEPHHWGPDRNVVSEYSTYSESTVQVFHNDRAVSSTHNGAGSHYSHITVKVRAFGQKFVLQLQKNRYLFSSSYVERLMTEDGEMQQETNNMNADHCFYIGSVEGHSRSTASASTCYGFLGEFTVGSETYSVEPVDEKLSGLHRVYRESDNIQSVRSCGNTEDLTENYDLMRTRRSDTRKRSVKLRQDLDEEKRIVEFYVVNDHSQYVAMGRNTTRTVTRTKTIVNSAAALYQPENIYIVLVGVEVWANGDLIYINETDKNQTLANFCEYRATNINPSYNNDNAQLLTGVQFLPATVGLAYVFGMCNYSRSCAFTHDYSTLPGASGAVMAHEMGHNFGFRHDEDVEPCTCDDSAGSCIMSTYLNKTISTRWSSCSKEQLVESLDEDLDYCLHNIPETIYDRVADCGNGIVDDGEQCDCGNAPASKCNRGCCSNCRLKSNASCAFGRCCDVATCQLKPATTECRAAKGPCDVAEHCSGDDPLCPSDVHKRNRDICTVNGAWAYCYNGECRGHLSQCRLWWGSEAKDAQEDCYAVNERGRLGANCCYDFKSGKYLPCDSGDVRCGTLHCDVSAVTDLTPNNYPLSFYGNWTSRFVTIHCRFAQYLTFYNGPDRPDPGLVPDGALCGTGKMCINRKCVDVKSEGEGLLRSKLQTKQLLFAVGVIIWMSHHA